uniref:Ion transport domain-containing protein n=1 Tax=Esox lucius TaxID=8010 RepID=A0A6Q2ZHU7_ESOLU
MTTEEEGPGAEGGVAISVERVLREEECDSDEEEDDGDVSTLIVPYPELAPVVFFCLSQTTFPRSWCISRFSTWFERCSIMVILLNCVTLGMYQPCECKNCSTDRCQLLETFDGFIFVFFAVEMVVKMLALGIFGRRCYLGDTWNRLDFLIVMAGMLEYSMDQQDINLTAIRTVRVLRPLKAINRVPSMRILVNLLLDTLPMLGNVLLICFFVFFIFGIIGVQLWAGKLRNRCYPEENFTLTSGITLPHTYYMVDTEDERPFVCSLSQDGGNLKCANIPARRQGNNTCCLNKDNVTQLSGLSNGSGLCVNWNQYYTRCLTGDKNPHKDAISFDNIARAWIVIFQVITLEGWVEIMYYVMNAHCFYNFIYFILLIIIGSFFMINLCLVVVASQFSETKQREHQLMEEQRAQANSCSTLDGLTEPSASCYESVFQLVLHVLRKACRYASVAWRRGQNTITRLCCGIIMDSEFVAGFVRIQKRCKYEKCIDSFLNYYLIIKMSPAVPCPHHSKPGHAPSGDPLTLPVSHNTSGCPGCVGALSGSDGAGPEGGLAVEVATHEAGGEDSQHGAGMDDGNDDAAAKDSGGCRRGCGKLWHEMRSKLCGIANSKYFNRGILIAILINSISMGIEHHNQPDELTNILEICNIVFTSMFALEMILKITAFGCLMYLKFPYNVLDGIIVIISVWEIVVQRDGGLSVLRTFRLLRVAKLIRFMPALRRQLVVLMKTVDSVATFCMLLMLFIFTFSILGMHIFGCKFTQRTETGDTVTDRKNFDSLLWAIVTVFQILTQEDWNVVLYNGMAATTPAVALYFVALMTFGNYVLFNLLVAILVEGYQAEVRFWAAAFVFTSLRSSWNSVGHPSQRLGRVDGAVLGGSLRARRPRPHSPYLDECESLLTRRGKASLLLSPDYLSRRALSLELPDTLQVPGGDPASPEPRKRSVSGGGSGGVGAKRHDCNGKMPVPVSQEALSLAEVFPQLNIAKDRPDLDEDVLKSSDSPFLRLLFRFRLLCQSIITHKLFDYVILVFIFLNCITVAVERPNIVQDSWERLVLSISNYAFTAIFVAEMTIKVVSQGLYLGETAYLRSSWNILDGFLVFISLIDIMVSMVAEAKILGVLRVLRLLRTLRPLRVISRFPGLRLVVETLITSLKPIGNIVLICCAFFLIFGILGVQFFKGKFYHCVGKNVKNITSKSDCIQANYQWNNQKYNFDNLGKVGCKMAWDYYNHIAKPVLKFKNKQ